MNLRVGDVVTLKSGSPDMTVVNMEEGNLTCSFFCDGKQRAFSAPHDAFKLIHRAYRTQHD